MCDPIIGGAALGLAGSVISSRSQSKASSKAVQAQQQATDQAVSEQRRQYDQSRQDMMPWLQTGQAALGQLSSLYGLNQTPQAQQYPQGSLTAPQPAIQQHPQSGGINYRAPGGDGLFGVQQINPQRELMAPGPGSATTTMIGQGQAVPVGQPQPQGQPAPGQTGEGQGGDFSSFWQSPDYQFRLNESMRALTARNAALGIQDSGAAQRSALGLAGDLASGEFNNYANRLAAISGLGQTTAQNQASLGAGYASNIGNLITQQGQNLASSHLQQGQQQGALAQSVAGIGAGVLNRFWPQPGAAGGGAAVQPGGSLYGLF